MSVPTGEAGALVVDDAESAAIARSTTVGYWKITSWLAFHQIGIPTLSGVIIRRNSDQAQSAVESFVKQNAYDSLLVRTDRRPEVPDAPRGGFLVPATQALTLVAPLLVDGRVVFLLSPLDPQNDMYSINAAVWPDDGVIEYEVVGPGFDASDLKRGDLTPHETFAIDVWKDATAPGAIKTHTVVSGPDYAESRNQRIAKVGLTHARTSSATSAYEQGAAYLEARPEALLLRVTEYPPIPRRLIDQIHASVQGLQAQLPAVGCPGAPFVVSVTITPAPMQLVYWDIVWPDHKYGLTAVGRR